MKAKIQKWGNSCGIRLPKSFLEVLGMAKDNLGYVNISEEENRIVIEPVSEVLTLEKIFEGYDGYCEPVEIDFGSPVGEEIF